MNDKHFVLGNIFILWYLRKVAVNFVKLALTLRLHRKEINQLLDTLEAVVNRGDVGGHHLHHQSSTASASSH